MKTKLYPFQEKGRDFHLAHHYSLNLCQMGLGKTIQALAVAEKAGGRTLIICPAFLQENWRAEIRKHIGSLDHVILPYSVLSKGVDIKLSDIRTIICDEIHYLKNPDAIRTQHVHHLVKHIRPTYFIGLTGTPIKNRVPEFYSLLSLVSYNPQETSGISVNAYFKNRDHFASRYCHLEEFTIGRTRIKRWHGFIQERADEFKQLLKNKVYLVKPEEVLNLPPMIHKRVQTNIKPSPELENEFDSFIRGGRGIVAKRASATLKAQMTSDYIKDIVEQGEGPVVVFTDHVDSAKIIASKFKVAAITGETPTGERSALTDRFNRGDTPVLVASIGALSVGVNLTRSCNLVFNDISWVPGDNFQAMKRIHRIGQTRPCVIHYILAGHIDEHILNTIQAKMAVIDQTNSLALDS